MQRGYNGHSALPAPDFQTGQKVWLTESNIRAQRPSGNIDNKRLRPIPILGKVGTNAYQLQLPEKKKVHTAFHVLLSELGAENRMDGQVVLSPPTSECR